MFLQKTFQCSQPFANVLQIRCCCKFPDNHKKYLCWSLFLIHTLIKLQDWWPATLLKKRHQHRCFPVNVLKCLKKTFYGTPPVFKIVATFCIEMRMIWFLKDRMSSVFSDLYEIKRLKNKSHTNRITQKSFHVKLP